MDKLKLIEAIMGSRCVANSDCAFEVGEYEQER